MFCPKCGKGVEADVLFCPDCGEKISSISEDVSKDIAVRRKPLGITLISIYTAFNGVLSLIVGTFMFYGVLFAKTLIGNIVPSYIVRKEEIIVPFWFSLCVILIILGGVASLASCYGLWSLQRWGQKLAIVLYMVFIPWSILGLFIVGITAASVILVIASIIADIVILRYFFKSQVQYFFR